MSDNLQFWENYRDFEELGEGKLVRDDKDANKKKIKFSGVAVNEDDEDI